MSTPKKIPLRSTKPAKKAVIPAAQITPKSDQNPAIRLRGVRQNNLKNLDVDFPLGALTVVTGVSGSGKSSLVFDTLYAEGQRRYVETFSPYARQFLDRLDKPQVDKIEGVPPAIAIDQTNPVRTSRSTVGTMTEINDHLKLLFARVARLYCQGCGEEVKRDSPEGVYIDLKARAHKAGDPRVIVTFPITVPENFSEEEITQFLSAQGYTRTHKREGATLYVVQDRFRLGTTERARIMEALDVAMQRGHGQVSVFVDAESPSPSGRGARGEGSDATTVDLAGAKQPSPQPSPRGRGSQDTAEIVWAYSASFTCANCKLSYSTPVPSSFSFNNPLGACDTCRGFGRVIGIDFGLVTPDERKSIGGGGVKPWQTESFKECQRDVEKYAKRDGIPLDKPIAELSVSEKRWLFEGDPNFVSWDKSWPKHWYGVRNYFGWLEGKAYKMHIRVLLSKYRAYTPCTACEGARLKPFALNFRLGDNHIATAQKFVPKHVQFAPQVLNALPGLSIHDLMFLPISALRDFFATIALPKPLDEATDLVLGEIRARLGFLCDVGLAYLTLDRQSRTLSGGEVQRINLTTALGTSLTHTLFVLDEPSIGLHPRDMERVIGVMQRLRSQGNTLVVVEHDPQIMFAADRLLDIGPGPGERGGTIVFDGAPHALLTAKTSRTAEYLLGHERITRKPRAVNASEAACIVLKGVRENNLRGLDVAFPLRALVCITGVSGSGKSTLVQNVLVPTLYKAKGKTTETPGAYDLLLNHQLVDDVVFVDQAPIGKSSRSNPASFVGAWDAVRAIYAKSPLAIERKYTAGTFSFNAGTGRCPVCSGTGFEHVEMQFLSDVYLRCADCDGTRFRSEVRELTVEGKSISDVLEMTVTEAIAHFAPIKGGAEVLRTLQPLADVGLEYLRLGQPVPTLSGGEAQRLKLAGHLAESVGGKSISGLPKRVAAQDPSAPRGKFFVFDEPTTGLHFDDIAKLLNAFDKLLDAGHSLLVIEHNLDVIGVSDWLIDLGPEGGTAGGEIVCVGTPTQVRAHATSHTGKALNDYEASFKKLAREIKEPRAQYQAKPQGLSAIKIHHAREHNLKNVSVDIPHKGFTVITGPSGSGKSTLAFDIVFNEGQRRYLESLNAYARQFVQPAARPEVDAIYGIPPTVAIEQRTSRGGRKSTVATLTEIYHFLRLLWMKLGTQYCPKCDVPITPQSADAIVASLLKAQKGKSVSILAPLVIARKGYYTDLAKWAKGKGFAALRVDGALLPTSAWPRLDRFMEHTIELPIADVVVSAANEAALRKAVADALDYGKGVLHALPIKAANVQVFSTKRACSTCGASYAELDPRLFSFNSKHGWCVGCQGTGMSLGAFRRDDDVSEENIDRVLDAHLDGLDEETVCGKCEGARLNPIARAVRLRDQALPTLTKYAVNDVAIFFQNFALDERETAIARDVVSEVQSRLQFLKEVGLGYLSLDRSAPTLSGGEAQRIRLAAQLGSNLQGVAYVLDEPTIGLHPRDNEILLNVLEKLEAKGNTLIVVEHDEDTIRRAHHVIDLGPGAGVRGGEIVAQGTAAQLAKDKNSLTGLYLRKPLKHPLQPYRAVKKTHPMIEVAGATLNNLQNATAHFPLERLTVVTGVSGSGKSTLARDVLYTNLRAIRAEKGEPFVPTPKPQKGPTQKGLKAKTIAKKIIIEEKKAQIAPQVLGAKSISGYEPIDRILEVDQTPIGKTPRSCPATYIGFWDNIRRIFSETTEAKMRGWTTGRFSFNTKGGRCDACDGQGVKTIEMSFLPDVKLGCDVCGGARFNSETRDVKWRDKSISDVLSMEIDEAVPFFEAHPSIYHPLKLLQDVGLGYLTLGQPSPTLSGGEAQRIKLVTELAKVKSLMPSRGEKKTRAARMVSPHTLYVLDEPTVGLHMNDVEKLIRVLHRLVDAGNTIVLIEHNLDVMAEADWIIDMGPEGGTGGGRVVVEGDVEKVVAAKAKSHTGRVMADFLKDRRA
jgi:excinuclease ABC subunit A